MTQPTNFQRVADMNVAFGNPSGASIDQSRRQCVSIGHEFVELLSALGVPKRHTEEILFSIKKNAVFMEQPDLPAVRDALCDIHVFAYGAHHLMGLDADKDMKTVIDSIYTRFIKDDADLEATKAKHFAKGVTHVYLEGAYPRMIMKAALDQPDAPKGKFLKSASYSEPVFE